MEKFLRCIPSFVVSVKAKRCVFMGEIPDAGQQQAAREAIKAKAPELEKKGEEFKDKLDKMSDEDIKQFDVDKDAAAAKDDIAKQFNAIMDDPVVNPKLGEGKFYLPAQYETHADIQPLREARDKAVKSVEKAQEDFKEKQKEIGDTLDLQHKSHETYDEAMKTMAENRSDLMTILNSDPAKLKMEDIQSLNQRLKTVNINNTHISDNLYADLQQNIDAVNAMKFKDSLSTVKFASDLMTTEYKSMDSTFNLVANDSQMYRAAASFMDGMNLRAEANATGDAVKFDKSKVMIEASKQAVDQFKLADIRIGVPGEPPVRVGTTTVESYEAKPVAVGTKKEGEPGT